jgi:hypothetical protein
MMRLRDCGASRDDYRQKCLTLTNHMRKSLGGP